MSTWRLFENIKQHTGFVLGAQYPTLQIKLEAGGLSQLTRSTLLKSFEIDNQLLNITPDCNDPRQHSLANTAWVLCLLQMFLEKNGLAIFEKARVLRTDVNQFICLVPVLEQSFSAVAKVVATTLNVINESERHTDSPTIKAAETELLSALKILADMSLPGSNMPLFLKTAYDRAIPFKQLPGGIFQFGYGSNARRLDSSFTHHTSLISAKLARNKVWATLLLKQAGLPVTNHVLVNNLDDAVEAAERVGFPVVVKPADLDGGVAVTSGIHTQDELRKAFEIARASTPNVLVEQHVTGKDYRLTVFNGKVIWAIERRPAEIVGNGAQTVSELIDALNADPRRGVSKRSPLKQVALDNEVRMLLVAQGVEESTVLPKSKRIRLRRAANVATGGQPVAVNKYVHPDNAQLAIRAAQVIGLDLAGIDLLIRDIRISWQDDQSDAAICEINGQPYLGQITSAHLYEKILNGLIQRNGRIPIFVIFGLDSSAQLVTAIESQLRARGLRVGTGDSQGVRLNDQKLTPKTDDFYSAGEILAMCADTDAIVLCLTDESIFKRGLPWARYDALLLVDRNIPSKTALDEPSRLKLNSELLNHIAPACDGLIVIVDSLGIQISGLEKVSSAKVLSVSNDMNVITREVVSSVLKRYLKS